MEVLYPTLRFHLGLDSFVLWLRWVSMESPPTPDDPPNQGIRVELLLNRNSVLGPSIVYRRDLSEPLYLVANRNRVAQVLRAAEGKALDISLVIHGSIANAPYAALYQVREYPSDAITTQALPATPLLQLQPSTPGDRWQVAGQANLRVQLELQGQARLTILS